MKIPLRLLNLALRLIEKRHLRRAKDPVDLRPRFERQARLLFRTPPFVLKSKTLIAGRPALWVAARAANRRKVILYFHGGAYVFGSPATHAAMVARLSEVTGLSALLPDYRMAPEDPFPAAVEDALAIYKALLDRGYHAKDIVLGGDSAGGGLVLALLQQILAAKLPRPAAVFGLSPWTDLTLSGETLHSKAAAEAVLPTERLAETAQTYLAGADPQNPLASPLFGDFAGAPDIMLQVGSDEILLDDSRRMADRLSAQGVNLRLDIWENAPHVWQIFQGRLEIADRALTELAGFLREKLSAEPADQPLP